MHVRVAIRAENVTAKRWCDEHCDSGHHTSYASLQTPRKRYSSSMAYPCCNMLHFASLPFRSSAGRPCCGARPTRDPPIVMSVLLFDCFVLVRCMSSLLCAPQACSGLAQLSRNGHFGLAPWWRSLCDCTTSDSTDIFWRVPRI